MPEFTANISGPGSVSSGYGAHESGASMIGEAIGGFAKVLDVGLKASAQSRMERLDVEIGDRLKDVVHPFQQQDAVGGQDVFTDGSMQQWEKAQGLDKIGKLAQANRHSPDRVSTASMMGQASAITQQIIHDHPRYADEIRARVQKILGVNPNEETIRSNLEDERTLKAQQNAQNESMARFALDNGVAPKLKTDGTLDGVAMARAGSIIKTAEYNMRVAAEQMRLKTEGLQQQNLQGEIDARNHPKPTAEALKVMNQNTYRAPLDPVFNLIMDHSVNAAVQTLANPGRGIPLKGGAANGPLPYANEQQFRDMAINGVAQAKATFYQKVQEYNTILTQDGSNPIDAASQREILSEYDAQFQSLHDLLVTAPKEIIEARMDTLHQMVTDMKIDFIKANPLLSKWIAGLGENTIAPTIALSLTNNPKASLGVAEAVTTSMNNLTDIATGNTTHIPDKTAAMGAAAANEAYGKKADNLTPTEKTAYGNITNALIQKGMSYNDPVQLAGAVTATSTPALLKAFDAYRADPTHADNAEHLGENLYALNSKYIAVASQTLKATTIAGRTYTPYYNPNAGRIEVEVKDGHGNIITNNLTYITNAEQYGAPGQVILRARQINSSLSALTHLKEFGAEATMSDAQLKEGMIGHLPLRPGTQHVLMPGEKKPETPNAALTKAPKPVPAAEDPIGIFQ